MTTAIVTSPGGFVKKKIKMLSIPAPGLRTKQPEAPQNK
jgi:hypothetical protein